MRTSVLIILFGMLFSMKAYSESGKDTVVCTANNVPLFMDPINKGKRMVIKSVHVHDTIKVGFRFALYFDRKFSDTSDDLKLIAFKPHSLRMWDTISGEKIFSTIYLIEESKPTPFHEYLSDLVIATLKYWTSEQIYDDLFRRFAGYTDDKATVITFPLYIVPAK